MADEQPDLRNAVAADTRPSLVVLPFDNISSDAEQGYLADGITADLTTELARLPGLFIISRNAAFTYKDKAIPPAQIATELGVRYILEGSIRRATRIKVGEWSDTGRRQVEGDIMCFSYPSRSRFCAFLLRNPAGTFAQKNEYFLITPCDKFEFSAVK